MDVHLDPAAPAPVVAYPDAGVLLVHYCPDDGTRLRCRVCPELAASDPVVLALHALHAADVPHDAADVAAKITRKLDEVATWRRTVASLAAGELVDEPATAPLARILEPAGRVSGPGPLDWHAEWTARDLADYPTEVIPAVVDLTEPIPAVPDAPPAWLLPAAPAAPEAPPRHRAAPGRRGPSWAVWAVAVAVLTLAGVVVLRPAGVVTLPAWPWPHSCGLDGGADQPAPPAERDAGGQGPNGQADRGDRRAPAPTTANPPTPTPAPTASSSPDSRSQIPGQSRTVTPAPTAPPSSPAPTTTTVEPPPTADPGVPAPSSSSAPEPTPVEPQPTDPTAEADPSTPGG